MKDGEISLSSQDETVRHFDLMVKYANHEVLAVDFIDISQWLGNRTLFNYLNFQLERASSHAIIVERIRFVPREEIQQKEKRQLIKAIIRMYEKSGATLLLCPYSEGEKLNLIFFPRMGILLIDKDTQPSCLMARLDEFGYIQRATLYLRDADPVRECRDDYARLKSTDNTSPGKSPSLADLPDGVALILGQRPQLLDLLGTQHLGSAKQPATCSSSCRPAWVRSRMRSRSNSASAPKTWKTSLPPLVVVSICSCRERKPTPRSCSCRTVSIRCGGSGPAGPAARRPGCRQHAGGRAPG
jgi:hypothetical protein